MGREWLKNSHCRDEVESVIKEFEQGWRKKMRKN